MMRFRREMGGIAAGVADWPPRRAGARGARTTLRRTGSARRSPRRGSSRAGRNSAAVQIRLAPNAITYWRDPGDAGVPPTFDFSGSTNVASVEPVFPAPTRIREADGSQAFGWSGGVTIPLRIHPKDAAMR